jgi:UDP-N-acetylmuramate--alanine ligase
MIGLRTKRNVHFIGIGGVGMSGLAEFLFATGYAVTGSDRQASVTTRRLEALGVKVQYDHLPGLVKSADIVVFSSAIKIDNQEIQYTVGHTIPLLRRAEVLGELMRMKFSVAIAGTHGKTTTTSLIGQILHDAGWNPTVIVGGILRHYDTNALVGTGDVLVAEADEFDRSFLKMYPSIAVVTNIEEDHLDCYSGIDDIVNAFRQFADIVPFYGALVACIDEPRVAEILGGYSKPVITYGLRPDADYTAKNVGFGPGGAHYDAYRRGEMLGRVTLPIPGMHNVKNSLAACAVAAELDVPFEVIARSLEAFAGVKRRFEIVGVAAGVTVIDDYAHHPSEIRATIAAAKGAGYKNVIAVFQPHLYTRTRDFMDGFASALSEADFVVVTSIYKSREEPIPGISGKTIVEKIIGLGHGRARYVENKETIAEMVKTECLPGEAVVVMGAGDINEICGGILKAIQDNNHE